MDIFKQKKMFKQSNAAASAAATVSHQPWVEK
jgi:hypothetical protein